MPKVKVKVKAKKGTGTLIARVPVAVAHTDKPRGRIIYGSTVQLTTKIKTNSRGEPRRN